ncbi:hypothetical protein BLAT2472_30437 [Burkholderia latens]
MRCRQPVRELHRVRPLLLRAFRQPVIPHSRKSRPRHPAFESIRVWDWMSNPPDRPSARQRQQKQAGDHAQRPWQPGGTFAAFLPSRRACRRARSAIARTRARSRTAQAVRGFACATSSA